MHRLALLDRDAGNDEAVLETDIMRFMAVIGIVFWIIFALVKSMPLGQENLPSSVARQATEPPPSVAAAPAPAPRPVARPKPKPVAKPKTMPPAPLRPRPAKPKPKPVPASAKVPTAPQAPIPAPLTAEAMDAAPAPAPSATTEAPPSPATNSEQPREEAPAAPSPAPEFKGVLLQFANFEDLLKLAETGRVRVFTRARAEGFDLLFESRATGGRMGFERASALPKVLWEIRTGRDRERMVALMSESFPSLRSFPDKDVFVAFEDRELEGRVTAKLDELRASDANGILSVSRSGQLNFKDMNQEQGEEQ